MIAASRLRCIGAMHNAEEAALVLVLQNPTTLCRGKFSMQIAAAAASQSALFPNLWLPSNDSGSVSIDVCNPWHLPDSIHAHSLPHPSMPSTCSGSEFLTLHANTKRESTKNRRVRQSKHYTKKHLQFPQFRNRNSHARTHFWHDDAFGLCTLNRVGHSSG